MHQDLKCFLGGITVAFIGYGLFKLFETKEPRTVHIHHHRVHMPEVCSPVVHHHQNNIPVTTETVTSDQKTMEETIIPDVEIDIEPKVKEEEEIEQTASTEVIIPTIIMSDELDVSDQVIPFKNLTLNVISDLGDFVDLHARMHELRTLLAIEQNKELTPQESLYEQDVRYKIETHNLGVIEYVNQVNCESLHDPGEDDLTLIQEVIKNYGFDPRKKVKRFRVYSKQNRMVGNICYEKSYPYCSCPAVVPNVIFIHDLMFIKGGRFNRDYILVFNWKKRKYICKSPYRAS